MVTALSQPEDILAFWRDAGRERWFRKDAGFDADILRNFADLHVKAQSGALAGWEDTDDGLLALIIILDQFSRNMFRNSARAFATDAMALDLADRALQRGVDRRVDPELRQFLYLPFMHSEKLADQERCIALCRDARMEENLKFAELHADIIRRFGRFPHRNRMLGRASTDDEQAFLDGGGFAG